MQLSNFPICFCRSTSYPMSLSRWPNSSHSMANLYLGKYRSIQYFPTANWWIISSLFKTCMIWLKVSCSLHNYLFLRSSISRRLVLLVFCICWSHTKGLALIKKTSVLFSWSLDPGQPAGYWHVVLKSFLMRISHFSRPLNDARISSSPKYFPICALLN